MRPFLLFGALALVVACTEPIAPGGEPVNSTVATEPFIKGNVTAIDPEWGFLVEAEPAQGYQVQAAWVRSDDNTSVEQAGIGPVVWESLTTGQTVSVWIEGPVMESLPPKVVAKTLVIE